MSLEGKALSFGYRRKDRAVLDRALAEFRKGLDSQAIQPCGDRSAYRQ